MENLKITHSVKAPRELVWKIWSDKEHLAKWFGPRGFPIVHAALDFEVGGVYHYAMEVPGGGRMWGKWIFREIAPMERLVFSVNFSDEEGGVTSHPLVANWPLEMLTVITFEDKGDQTLVSIDGSAPNASDLERAVFEAGKPGMKAGWMGTFSQLDEYVKTVAA